MNDATQGGSSRRDFLKGAGALAAATALAGTTPWRAQAAGDGTIQIVLIGCGGRGTGAVGDALSGNNGPLKLVAMVDVFPEKLKKSFDTLKKKFPDKIDVPEEHKFIGFDGFRKAMDLLNAGDVVILATPPAFRWVMFDYAIKKGLHTFMEKPISVDGPTTRKMLKLGETAKQKNLKVAVGLMIRHCRERQELHKRIQDGQIGQIIAMRAYRMSAKSSKAYCGPKPENISEVLYQINNFHSFLWASGGCFSDYYIHQIDECSWMKNAWPVEAMALGGRHYRNDALDQNFDTYSVEYTYPDGTKLFYDGRNMDGCHNEFASYAHGTKGSAVITTSSHVPGNVRIFKGQKIARVTAKDKLNLADPSMLWAYPQPERSPYVYEWEDLISAIREDKPYNEVKRGAEASLVGCMGRMAAHTGQLITFDQMLNCEHEFAPGVDKLTMNGPAPLLLNDSGKYPVPQPGIVKNREY